LGKATRLIAIDREWSHKAGVHVSEKDFGITAAEIVVP
jgi:hypothetical protein